MEEWKDIKGYEGLYQVSSLGRVKNSKDYIKKTLINYKTGYCFIKLSNKSKEKSFYLHRLVAQTFIPNPDNLPCVNHKNEDKTDNRVENLEWCTYQYNNRYSAYRLGRKGKTVYQYTIDGQLIVSHISVSEAAKKLGFKISHICNCCNGKIESAYGYKWSYELGTM